MSIVLLNRIAKLVLVAIHIFLPVLSFVRTRNPSRIILRFNNKYAMRLKYNMVNLCRTYTAWYCDVIDDNIIFW